MFKTEQVHNVKKFLVTYRVSRWFCPAYPRYFTPNVTTHLNASAVEKYNDGKCGGHSPDLMPILFDYLTFEVLKKS